MPPRRPGDIFARGSRANARIKAAMRRMRTRRPRTRRARPTVSRRRVKRGNYRRNRRNRVGTANNKIPSLRSFVQYRRGPAPQRPSRVRVKCPYTGVILMGGTVVGPSQLVPFRLNAPFDPQYVGGIGDQPLGYPDLAAQYSRGIVHNTTVQVNIEIRDTSLVTGEEATSPVIIAGIHYSSTQPGTSMSTFDTEAELLQRVNQRFAGEKFYWRRMSRVVSGYNAAIGPGGRVYLRPIKFRNQSTAFTANRPYGIVTSDAVSDPYGVSFATNGLPTFNQYFSLFCFSQPINQSEVLDLPATYFTLRIVYDIEFFGPNVESQVTPEEDVEGEFSGVEEKEPAGQ